MTQSHPPNPATQKYLSMVGVDTIITRGDKTAYVDLLKKIISDPNGKTAEIVIKLDADRQKRSDRGGYATSFYAVAAKIVELARRSD